MKKHILFIMTVIALTINFDFQQSLIHILNGIINIEINSKIHIALIG